MHWKGVHVSGTCVGPPVAEIVISFSKKDLSGTGFVIPDAYWEGPAITPFYKRTDPIDPSGAMIYGSP